LIIDDEYDITPIVRIKLEGDNFGIDMWKDPKIALSNYRPNFYDLIVLNLKLPYSSGYEVYNKIRYSYKDAKFVF
jgi:DNA-binding response OmpR family regulator